MNLNSFDRLSVLACVSGLALLAIFFAALWLGAPNPEWLPMVIAAIAGFEMFMAIRMLRQRRADGGSNG